MKSKSTELFISFLDKDINKKTAVFLKQGGFNYENTKLRYKKKTQKVFLVAEGGLEPPTFGL